MSDEIDYIKKLMDIWRKRRAIDGTLDNTISDDERIYTLLINFDKRLKKLEEAQEEIICTKNL